MKTKMKLLVLACFSTLSLALVTGCGDDDDAPPFDAGTDSSVTPPPDNDSGPPPDKDAGTDAALPTGLIDRMGRPAINTALNFHDDARKDAYNHQDTYADPAAGDWNTNFSKNLNYADSLDKTFDWTATGKEEHPLAAPLKLDVLIVDTSKTCTDANNFCETGYLDIEADLLLDGDPTLDQHQTCGGRTPAEDVVDKTLSVLVTKGQSPVTDKVDAPTKPPTHTFPYLAEPN